MAELYDLSNIIIVLFTKIVNAADYAQATDQPYFDV